jgi:hypothetical protein
MINWWHGMAIDYRRPAKARMTVEEALRQAAWLISVAGEDERFKEILQAVRNT